MLLPHTLRGVVGDERGDRGREEKKREEEGGGFTQHTLSHSTRK